MTTLCRFCFAQQTAVRLRAKAKFWDEQKLPNLAGPYEAAALDFEGMAYGEQRCKCGEPLPKRPKRKRKPIDPDSIDDAL